MPTTPLAPSTTMKTVASITTTPQGDGVSHQVQIQRGRSTSEFGITVGAGFLAAVVTAAHVMQVIPGPWPLIGSGILAGLAALGYSVSRGITKAAAITAVDK